MESEDAISTTPNRRIRRAGASFGVAWATVAFLWVLWSRPWVEGPLGGTRWADDALYLLIVGGFGAIGWAVTVLPLAAFADHGGWFFRPRTAPLVGFLCGVAILLLEYAVFFEYPPREVFEELEDPGVFVPLLMAGIFGGVLWWHYTRKGRSGEWRPPSASAAAVLLCALLGG